MKSTAAATIVPTQQEQKALGAIARKLDRKAGKAQLVSPDGSSMILPDALFEVLHRAARALGSGHAVRIMPVETQMTTQQAADFLQVSRPYFVGLLEKEQIPFHKIGTHRRVYLRDLIAYRERIEAKSRAALKALVDEAQDLGIYDE